MTADTPEALHARVEAALNAGDLDAFAELYEDGAVLVVPPDGHRAGGRTAILAAMAPLLAQRPQASFEVAGTLCAGELALLHGRWHLTLAGEALAGTGTLVARRGADGVWRIVLDDPLAPH